MKFSFKKVVLSLLNVSIILSTAFSTLQNNSTHNNLNLHQSTYSDNSTLNNTSLNTLQVKASSLDANSSVLNQLKATQNLLQPMNDSLFGSLTKSLNQSDTTQDEVQNKDVTNTISFERNNDFNFNHPTYNIEKESSYWTPRYSTVPIESYEKVHYADLVGDQPNSDWNNSNNFNPDNSPSFSGDYIQGPEIIKLPPSTIKASSKKDDYTVTANFQSEFNKWNSLKTKKKSENSKLLNVLNNSENKAKIIKNYTAIKNGDYNLVTKSIDKFKSDNQALYKKYFQNSNQALYTDYSDVQTYFNSESYLSQLFESSLFKATANLPEYKFDNEHLATNDNLKNFQKWMTDWNNLISKPNNNSVIIQKINLPFNLEKDNLKFYNGYFYHNDYSKTITPTLEIELLSSEHKNYRLDFSDDDSQNNAVLYDPSNLSQINNVNFNHPLNQYLGSLVKIPSISSQWLTWKEVFNTNLKTNNPAELFYKNVNTDLTNVLDQVAINNLSDLKGFENLGSQYTFLEDQLPKVFQFWNFGITKNGYNLFLNKFKSIIDASKSKYEAVLAARKKQHEEDLAKARALAAKIKAQKEATYRKNYQKLEDQFNQAKNSMVDNLAKNTVQAISDNAKASIKDNDADIANLSGLGKSLDENINKMSKKQNALHVFGAISATLTAVAWAVSAFYYASAFWTFGGTIPEAIGATVQASIMTYFTTQTFNEYNDLGSKIHNLSNKKDEILTKIKRYQDDNIIINNGLNHLQSGSYLISLKKEIENTLNQSSIEDFQKFRNSNKFFNYEKSPTFQQLVDSVGKIGSLVLFGEENPLIMITKQFITFFVDRLQYHLSASKVYSEIEKLFDDTRASEFLSEFSEDISKSKLWDLFLKGEWAEGFEGGLENVAKFIEKYTPWSYFESLIQKSFGILDKGIEKIAIFINKIVSRFEKKVISDVTLELTKFAGKLAAKRVAIIATSWANPVMTIISALDVVVSIAQVVVVDFNLYGG